MIRDIFFWVSIATFPLLLLFVKEALRLPGGKIDSPKGRLASRLEELYRHPGSRPRKAVEEHLMLRPFDKRSLHKFLIHPPLVSDDAPDDEVGGAEVVRHLPCRAARGERVQNELTYGIPGILQVFFFSFVS